MKKLIASAGLVALGTAGLHAAYAPGLTEQQTSKPWTVSASLRGFYDDNITTASISTNRQESFGFEIRPKAELNLPLSQTLLQASYAYSMKYYADRQPHKADHTHEFEASLKHTFSERYKMNLSESFVSSQEPEILGADIGSPQRSNADAIHNAATLEFSARVTELLELVFGYEHNYYDYKETGVGTRSPLLDRVEHLVRLNSDWHVNDKLIARMGYQFGIVDYTSDELLFTGGPRGKDRKNKSHYLYLGADYKFNQQLSGTIQVGGQLTSYDNAAAGGDTFGPYVDLSATYKYAEGSNARLGFKHARNATDVVSPDAAGGFTVDQETSTVYSSVTHKITPKLNGNLIAQYQLGAFNGGVSDNLTDKFFILGLNFDYRFTKNFSGELGYNWDHLVSNISDRSFTRNRIFIGVRATY